MIVSIWLDLKQFNSIKKKSVILRASILVSLLSYVCVRFRRLTGSLYIRNDTFCDAGDYAKLHKQQAEKLTESRAACNEIAVELEIDKINIKKSTKELNAIKENVRTV